MFFRFGVSVCTEWILSFVEEILGVRTGPQGSWFYPANSLPEFLDLWSIEWSYIQYCWVNIRILLRDNWTVSMCWKDLELCTGDGCKNWPTRELVPPWNSLPEFLDLWSIEWSYIQYCRVNIRILLRDNWTVSMCWKDLELCTGDGCKNWPTKELVPPWNSLPEFLDL